MCRSILAFVFAAAPLAVSAGGLANPPAAPDRQGAHDALRGIGQQAVEISYDSVVNPEVQRLLFRNDELAQDEF